MKNLVSFVISLSMFGFFSACGPENMTNDPAATPEATIPPTDALLYYSSDEWPISCYFYDPKSKDFGQNLPLWNQAWVWAKTQEGAQIHAQGIKDGGFVRADAIYSSKGKKVGPIFVDAPGADLMPAVRNTDGLEDICQRSIDVQHKGKGYKLIGIVASRDTKTISNLRSNAFPIVYGESTNENPITRVVIFGDSLSDTGRLKRWIQIMPERPFFLGRFSNGGTWSDFLAKQANLAVVNYSTGGAVTKDNVTYSIKQVINYVKDIGRYFVTSSIRNFVRDYTNNELSHNRIPEPEKTLFVLWGGANDFLSRFDRKEDINTFIDNPDALGAGSNSITDQTVFNIEQEIRGLVALGAKNILVANLPDMGKTPRMTENSGFRGDSPKDKYVFAQSLSGIIARYNEKLVAKITELQGSLSPRGVKIILFDAAQALNNLMEGLGPDGKPFDYGIDMTASFTKLSAPNQPDIKVGKKCFQGSYLGSSNAADICPNAATMLFWDEVHPTAKGHCGLAYLMHVLLNKNGLIKTPANFAAYQTTCSAP